MRATSPDERPPRPHRVDVGVYVAGGDGLVRTALVPVETTGERTAVPAPPEAHLLLVNDEDLTFAATRPDAGSVQALVARSGDLPTPMARALAVSTAWDMLAWGELGAAELVRCAVSAARRETEAGVAQDFLTRAMLTAELWAPPREREGLLEEVADLSSELAADPSLRRSALLTLAATARRDAHVEQVRAAAATDTDLGWRLLVRLAELGRLEPGEVEALLARDRDPDAWVRALQVRAAQPDPEAKEEVWRAVFVDRTVPVDRALHVAPAFWRPGQADLLREYTYRYLDAVRDLTGGNLAILAYTRYFFPTAVGDEDFLAEVDKVADADGTNPTLRLNLLQRADALRRMLRARQAGA